MMGSYDLLHPRLFFLCVCVGGGGGEWVLKIVVKKKIHIYLK